MYSAEGPYCNVVMFQVVLGILEQASNEMISIKQNGLKFYCRTHLIFSYFHVEFQLIRNNTVLLCSSVSVPQTFCHVR